MSIVCNKGEIKLMLTMTDNITLLRQLNYELIRELGLFTQRGGLSFSQRHTLYHIQKNTRLSIQELAEIMHVEHSTMSRNVKKLIHEELVVASVDSNDKRKKVIYLSAKGEIKLQEATDTINQMLENAIQPFDNKYIELIISGVQAYISALKNNNKNIIN